MHRFVNKLCFILLFLGKHGKILVFYARKREKEEFMECNKCGQPLEEGQTVCPSCGEDNQVKKPKKKMQKKTLIAIIAVSVVLAILLSLVGVGLYLINPWQKEVEERAVYVTSEYWSNTARDVVVATVGDFELTNSQLQVFYWMQIIDQVNQYIEQYGSYAEYYIPFDWESPLSEQMYSEEMGMTWEQFFLEAALYSWRSYRALTDAAQKNGYQVPAENKEYLAGLEDAVKKEAEEEGYASADALIQANLGTNVTFEDYYYYEELYCIGYGYYNELVSKLAFTDAEMEEYFQKNEETLKHYGVTKDSGNLVDFRNILIKPLASQDDEGNTVYTEESWDECMYTAESILKSLQSMNLTEDIFAGVAKIQSSDSYSASNGGLYQYIARNDMATVDVRHILIMPKGGTKDENGDITYSDAEWEACRVAAQSLLDQYLAGDKTEEAFGELANKHSEDKDGKVTDGGLYANIVVGDMVKPFEDWIFDSARTPGETGLVKTEYGYHVMYFVKRTGPIDEWLFAEGRKGGDLTLLKTDVGYQILYYVGDDVEWEVWCENGLRTLASEELLESYLENWTIDVRYWAIALSQRATTE